MSKLVLDDAPIFTAKSVIPDSSDCCPTPAAKPPINSPAGHPQLKTNHIRGRDLLQLFWVLRPVDLHQRSNLVTAIRLAIDYILHRLFLLSATLCEPSTGLCFSSQPPRANPPQVFTWSKIALHKHFTLFYLVFTPCSIGQSSSRIFDSHTNPFGTTLPLTNIISLYVPSSRCKGRTNQTFQKVCPPVKQANRKSQLPPPELIPLTLIPPSGVLQGGRLNAFCATSGPASPRTPEEEA
ncbi:hypothetical protein PCANC_13380 [Puccinia coronata f. sp. avenae]|uniref:Uncharacterized protein n=1 Tax=Puccinia coronata f. sp. avenae TaxID=200324 RepID=A0A2N5VTQ9_9BASI|nr:hypothetical protein PCANC_13380 [Puccinia coronata f. sp. avenae]